MIQPKSFIRVQVVLLSACVYLVSCSTTEMQEKEKRTIIPTDTFGAVSNNAPAATEAVNYVDEGYPFDSVFQADVLTTGIFHEDEVKPDAHRRQWFGLFKGAAGFYLRETPITTRRVYDPILDESEQVKTGWEVSTPVGDSNYLLIEALPFLKNRPVQNIAVEKKFVLPGDTLRLSVGGNEYVLFAIGEKKQVEDEPGVFTVENYRLYLAFNKGGQASLQLLVAQPRLDDKMVEILFAGDIDGDGSLDLIIDTSGHYNVFQPTLYLSKPAENLIVKPVGRHTVVGC